MPKKNFKLRKKSWKLPKKGEKAIKLNVCQIFLFQNTTFLQKID